MFMDIINDSCLSQIVTEPTREANILDLVLRNMSNKVLKLTVILGVSDHKCASVKFEASPLQRKHPPPPPRKIPTYKRVNWAFFQKDLKETSNTLNKLPPDTTADDSWKLFKNAIFEGIEKHIPIKQLKLKTAFHT